MRILALMILGLMVVGCGKKVARAGSVLTERKKMVTLEASVALKWSDGVFDDPPLCAHVYLEPHMDGKSVRLRVYLGRTQPDFFLPGLNGEIDVVKTAEEAVAKWSTIHWSPEGLHLGDGNRTHMFFPRAKIKPVTR